MEERTIKIAQYLCQLQAYISIEELAGVFDVSKRTIYHEIEIINNLLGQAALPEIMSVRNVGIKLTDIQRQRIESFFSTVSIKSISDPKLRIPFLMCIFLGVSGKIDIKYLLSVMDVSRNTLFADLKQARYQLSKLELGLEYTSKNGYEITGSIIKKRSLFIFNYIELTKNAFLKEEFDRFFIVNQHVFDECYQKLKIIEKKLNTEYLEQTLSHLALVMSLEKLNANVYDTINSHLEVTSSLEYQLIVTYFPSLIPFDHYYYAIHLLGSMTQIRSVNPKMVRFLKLAILMVERFQVLGAIEFTHVSQLVMNLANHLSISYYRYQFGLHQSNPLTDEIKSHYPEVFELTNQVCDLIRNQLKVPVSDGEVAYITLHFNSFIYSFHYYQKDDECIIVCPQGLSTSAMLKQEISQINPQLMIHETLSLGQFNQLEPKINVKWIISTVPLKTQKPYLLVNAILSAEDKLVLRSKLGQDVKHHQVDQLMQLVLPYIKEEDYDSLHAEISQFLKGKKQNPAIMMPGLNQTLTLDHISIVESADSFQEGIYLSCETLLKEGVISEQYPKAIIMACEKFGPYMAIDHGFALMHAGLMDGVYHLGISFTYFKKGFMMGNKLVNKVFTLAPKQKLHLKMMSELLSILSDEHLHLKIDSASSREELLSLLINRK